MSSPIASPRNSERNIVLCLSGGGFRATFFHLGVLRYLAEANLLDRVRDIFAVSGGSILAGHLGLNWPRYAGDLKEFDNAAREVIAFGRSNVRRKLLRGFMHPWRRRTRRYQRILDRFYGRRTLPDIKKTSDHRGFHFLTTSANSGVACAITSDGVFDFLDPASVPFPIPDPRVALAVAASSAFPALFNPLPLEVKKRRRDGMDKGDPIYDERLIDGGVYDNVGIVVFQEAVSIAGDARVVVSDASAVLEWDTRSALIRSILGLFSRTWRSTDILMKRVAALAAEKAMGSRATGQGNSPGTYWLRIDRYLPASAPERRSRVYLEAALREAVAKVRTDLDAFTAHEAKALAQSGFETAHLELGGFVESLGGNPIQPHEPWDPFRTMGLRHSLGVAPGLTIKTVADLGLRQLWRLCTGKDAFAAPEVAVLPRDLAQSHRLRLLKLGDYVFLGGCAALVLLSILVVTNIIGGYPSSAVATPATLNVFYGEATEQQQGASDPMDAFQRALYEASTSEPRPDRGLRLVRAAALEGADVVLTNMPDGEELIPWRELLESPLVDLPSDDDSAVWRQRAARLLQQLRLGPWANFGKGQATDRLGRLSALYRTGLAPDAALRGGIPLLGDVPVLFYNASLLGTGASENLPQTLASLWPSERLMADFLTKEVERKLYRKGPASVIVAKGSLQGGCIASGHVCLSEDLLEKCSDRKASMCREADSPRRAMGLLLNGKGVLLPGWLSWAGQSLAQDISRYPVQEDGSRVRWWYLGVAKTSERKVEAANAILQLTRDLRVQKSLKEAGYLCATLEAPISPRGQ